MGCLIDMKKPVYPNIMKEFFSNLDFDSNLLKGEMSLWGMKCVINQHLATSLLGFKVTDPTVKIFECNNVIFQGYIKRQAIKMFTGSNQDSIRPADLDDETRVLHHAITQLLVPKSYKKNSPNNREIFYLWCVKNSYVLDVPFIILSHMKAFLASQTLDMP